MLENLKYKEVSDEIEIQALKNQSLYGNFNYLGNDEVQMFEDTYENMFIPIRQAWKNKSQMKQTEAQEQLIQFLNQHYQDWNFANKDKNQDEKREIKRKINKHGIVQLYSILKGEWKDRYIELRDNIIYIYRDSEMTQISKGPFNLAQESKLDKISLQHERYCFKIIVEDIKQEKYQLDLGFKISQDAIAWMDLLKKAQKQLSLKNDNQQFKFEEKKELSKSMERRSASIQDRKSNEETKESSHQPPSSPQNNSGNDSLDLQQNQFNRIRLQSLKKELNQQAEFEGSFQRFPKSFYQQQLDHEFQDEIFTPKGDQSQPNSEAVPNQLQSIVEMLNKKNSNGMLKINDQKDTLIFTENNLRIFLSLDKQKLCDSDILSNYFLNQVDEDETMVLKVYFFVECPLSIIKKLLDEPEKYKDWDQSIQQTNIINYLPSLNSKIYHNIYKATKDFNQEWQQVLISYTSDILERDGQSLFYFIQQTQRDSQSKINQGKTPISDLIVNITIVKQDQKSNRTEFKQYLCINIKQILNKGMLSWMYGSSLVNDCKVIIQTLNTFYQGLLNQTKPYLSQKQAQEEEVKQIQAPIQSQVQIWDLINESKKRHERQQELISQLQLSRAFNEDENYDNDQEEEKGQQQNQTYNQVNDLYSKYEENNLPFTRLTQRQIDTLDKIQWKKPEYKEYVLEKLISKTNYDEEFFQDLKNFFFQRGESNKFYEDLCFRIDKKIGLVYTDKELIKKQRGVLGYFLKKMASNVLQGKPLIQVSMPVTVFDANSLLSKHADIFGTAPYFYDKARKLSSDKPEEALLRFKYCLAFSVAQKALGATMKKPFNPIFCETFQCTVGDYNFCSEQISHHPPIFAYQTWSDEHDEISTHGTMEFRVELKPNAAQAVPTGCHTFCFKDGTKIKQYAPRTELSGLMYGDRVIQFLETLYLIDEKNELYADLVFNPERKSGLKSIFNKGLPEDYSPNYIEGVISNNPKIDYKNNRGKLVKGRDYLCDITGDWTDAIYIDGESFWSFNDFRGFPKVPHKDPLPSDTNRRQDIIYLREGNEEKSQEIKDELENLQRHYKKIRDAGAKRRKKNKK